MKDLHLRKESAVVEVAHAAANRLDRVAGQAQDQVDLDLDAFAQHGANAALKGPQVVLAVHHGHGPRLDRLQTDLDFREIRLTQQPGRFLSDALAAQLAEVAKAPARVADGE